MNNNLQLKNDMKTIMIVKVRNGVSEGRVRFILCVMYECGRREVLCGKVSFTVLDSADCSIK